MLLVVIALLLPIRLPPACPPARLHACPARQADRRYKPYTTAYSAIHKSRSLPPFLPSIGEEGVLHGTWDTSLEVRHGAIVEFREQAQSTVLTFSACRASVSASAKAS